MISGNSGGGGYVNGPVRFVTAAVGRQADALSANDYVVSVNAAYGPISELLPGAAAAFGRRYVIKKSENSANAVTISDMSGLLIEGASSLALVSMNQWVELQSDGTQWLIVGGNKGAVRVLAQSGAPSSVTGTTTTTALATIPVPGNALGTAGALRVTAYGSVTNNSNAKSFSVSLGGVTFVTGATSSSAGFNFQTVLRNQNNSKAQTVFPSLNSYGATSTAAPSYSIDTTQQQNLVISGTLANAADTLTLQGYTVEILNP